MPSLKIKCLPGVSQIMAALRPATTTVLSKPAATTRDTSSISRLLHLLPFARIPPQDPEHLQMVGKYVNLDLARQIVEENRSAVVPRDPDLPPDECGLLAIVAYTAGHLDRKIAAVEQLSDADKHRPEARQLLAAKGLIAETVGRIQKIDVPVVRRNVQLTRAVLDAYSVGKTVQFDRLTSVTCAPAQVYTGGNVDFIIHTASGVVSLSPLSLFKNNGAGNAGGEAEGMPDVGSRYQVVDLVAGKENGKPSLDEESYRARTITLREIVGDK